MKELHLLNQEERQQFFELAAYESEKSYTIIEKDYWVVWILERLFSITELKSHITFKGGTSLSKIFGVIERFSEDIDVSIDKEFLGFDDNKNPESLPSRKKQQMMLTELSQTCAKYIQENLFENLTAAIKEKLITQDNWKLTIDDFDSQTLLFHYPCLLSKDEYIRPIVKIEMGARSEHWPVSMHPMQSYAKMTLKEKISEPELIIRVLDAERTFWEKATILHQYAHLPENKDLPSRLSRHWYDFFKLLNSPVKELALRKSELLDRVANHKKIYFASSWAHYDSAKKGTIKFIPSDRILNELKKDYVLMKPMFFGDAPDWGEMMVCIEKFEKEFNHEKT